MYRKKDDLKRLVDSLSIAEKRYFNLSSKMYNTRDQASYMKLFDVINKNADMDAVEIPSRNLTVVRRDLYRNILKSLRILYQNKPESILQNLLSEVEILYNKNLRDQSSRTLFKAKREAYKSEEFGILLQILEWERKLNALIDKPERTAEEITDEFQKIIDFQNNILELERLNSKTIEYKRKFGYVRGNFKKQFHDEILSAPALASPDQCHSQKALYYFYHTLALSHFMIYDYEKSYKVTQLLLSLNMKTVPLRNYLNGLLQHTTSCVCLGYFEEALNYLKLAQTLIDDQQFDSFNVLSLKVFYYRSNYELVCYMYMGEKEKTISKIEEIEEAFKLYADRIPYEMKQVINSGLRNAYLSVGNYEKVDEVTDVMLHRETKSTRNDIYDDLLLFRLIWLFQIEMFEIIPSVALSAFRYYKNYKNEDNRFDIELEVSQLLIKEQDFTNLKTKKDTLIKLKKIFQWHIKKLSPKNGFLEHYSYYIIWLDSLLSGKTFYEEAGTWYHQFL